MDFEEDMPRQEWVDGTEFLRWLATDGPGKFGHNLPDVFAQFEAQRK